MTTESNSVSGERYGTLVTVSALPDSRHGDWIFVDCRSDLRDQEAGKRAYLAGHIPGAYYAHLENDLSGAIVPGVTGRHPLPDVDDFLQLVGSWGVAPKDQVVIYDQGHGGIAARLWWMLQWIGHEAAAVLDGGWTAYLEANRPVELVEPSRVDRMYPGTVNADLVVDRSDVKNRTGHHDFVLVDARDERRYLGIEEPIDPVAGHIPGAVSMPFKDNLTDGNTSWKNKAELISRWKKVEDLEDHTIVHYCGSGVTACHNILTLKHIGGPMTKLYPGSWSEWITSER